MERCSAAAGCLAGEGAGEAMAAMAMLCSLDCCCAVLCCVVLFCCGGWRAVVVRYVWLLVLVLVVWWAGLLPAAGCCTATTPRLHRTHLGLYSYVRASPPYIHLHTPTRTYYTHAAHLALPNRRATFKKKHPPPRPVAPYRRRHPGRLRNSFSLAMVGSSPRAGAHARIKSPLPFCRGQFTSLCLCLFAASFVQLQALFQPCRAPTRASAEATSLPTQ